MKLKVVTGIMLFLLITSMLTVAFNLQAVNSALPLISLNPVDCSVQLGMNFTIDVNITNVEDLGVFELHLSYNTTILDAVRVNIKPPLYPEPTAGWDWMPEDAQGVFHPDGPPTINDTAGYVWVACYIPVTGPGTGLYGNFTLISINFTAKARGNSALHLYEIGLGDSQADPIDFTTLDGSVMVEIMKIGVIGPMAWMQGQGMKEGAEIAMDEINAGGGILGQNVELVFADTLRGMPNPTAETGTAAAMELVAAGVDFVVGGFSSEAVFGAREVFMDYKKIFFIAGAATNELVDCGIGNCTHCVRCNYARYKYTFRMTPVNSTMLLYSIAVFSKYTMIEKLMPIYGTPLKIAVITENLPWADVMHAYLTSEYFWNVVMGMQAYGNVSVVYNARVSPVATNVSAELSAAKAAGARLIIPVLSGPVGRTFITQWKDLGVEAVPVGIDMSGQEIPFHWEATGGKCEYETFLASSGTRTPLSARALAFWDAYVAEYGHAPIYTSYGAYDTMIAIKEMIEAAGRWPMTADEMVPLIEQTDRVGLLGKFKFTGPHPMGPSAYDTYMANATHSYLDVNPTMKGTLHDVFCNEIGANWTEGYVRPLVVQWQKSPTTGKARLEVVYPKDGLAAPFARKWEIPTWIYSLAETDINYDGSVNWEDLGALGSTYGATAGEPNWNSEADIDGNGIINIADLDKLAKDYGEHVNSSLSTVGVPLGTASPLPATTQTNSKTTVYLDQPTINGTAIGVGNKVTVYINISDAVDIHGWQAGLTFNSSLLKCEGFYEYEFLANYGGTIWEPPNVTTPIDNEAGVIAPHGCSLTGDVSANGSGQLAYFRFEVIKAEVSDLHLRDVMVMDYREDYKMVKFNIIDVYTVTHSAAQTIFIVSNSTGVQSDDYEIVDNQPVLTVYGSGFYGHAFSHLYQELNFSVTGPYPAFSNVTIPKELIQVRRDNPDKLLVAIDGIQLRTEERIVTKNETHYFVYFNYTMGIRNISHTESPRVYNKDSNLYYTKIQEAIKASETSDGHKILVDEGIYYEHVVVEKSVSLIAENMRNTTIDGSGNGTAVKITANNANMTGFTIKNSGPYPNSGIYVSSSGNNITQNNVTNNHYGIHLYYASNNNLTNNNASNNEIGICLYHSSGNSLYNNTMVCNKYNFGLYGTVETHFDNDIDPTNKVDDKQVYFLKEENNVYNSLTNVGTLYLIDCDNVTIRNLTLTKNVHGIFLWNTNNSKIENVTSSNNLNGIYLQGQSNYNNLTDNNVSNNKLGIYLNSSNNNKIFHNSFIDNTIQANVTESYNTIWDDGYPSGGNYWSDYIYLDYFRGPNQDETGNDAIWDREYAIDENNRDNYPLVSPLTPPVFNIITHLGYERIQEAIDAAQAYHTIIVRAGTYQNVTINKPLTLIGIIGSTVINGSGTGTVVNITNTHDVTLKGFTIKGGSSSTADQGILLSYADNVVISENTINKTVYGIKLDHSYNCIISGNILTNNTQGIRLEYSDSAIISRNNITNNAYGIYLIYSDYNDIHRNNITDNTSWGISLPSSSYNKIYHNNFINNTNQAYSELENTWDDGGLYPCPKCGNPQPKGNYWSDYKGLDDGTPTQTHNCLDDEIGDTDTPHLGVDKYPLMSLRTPQHDVALVSVIPSRTSVPKGIECSVNITVTVRNLGDYIETFNVTVYYNDTAIILPNGKDYNPVILPSESPTTIIFTWNATDLAKGNWTISANVTVVPGETYTTDNKYTDGWVLVTKQGDVDCDGDIDALDVKRTKMAYGGWIVYPNADVDCDGDIDILDVKRVKMIYGGYIVPVDP